MVRCARSLLVVALFFTFHVSLLTAQVTQPMVAIHDSELTRALESMPASGGTPTGPGTTGNQWWPTDWHYFVMPEAMKEAMRSDGTAFAVVGDSNIVAGALLSGGLPKYPIVVSLASEAIRDDEIAAFTNYVAAGGYLLVGSSSFTRTTNGTARGDFAFANELGVHSMSSLTNWAQNNNFVKTNQLNHRLVSHIPAGTNTWRMPSASEEIPWGISPGHPFLAAHDVWRVQATTATVLANGDATPFLTIKPYGKGYFIYCAAFQPLIGHSGFAPGMYAYVIVRRAIEWAFESAQMPVTKLSPWPFQYDAAWMIRHDLENFTNEIAAVEASAQVEFTNGARGDYYFCTGTLRDDASPTYNTNTLIAGLRRATTNYGATIGPHNGGLKNPNNPSLTRGQYDYWHWGPDEALDVTPAGYASGKAYASASLSNSFNDIERWLSGITNGVRGWVGCYFNSTREDSYDLQSQLGIKIVGEQKLTPFPHWTLSTQTPGKRYAMLSEPVSDWFVGGLVAQSLEPWHYPGVHTSQTMHDGVDFYYNLGALINFYSHTLSTGLGDAGQLVPDYITYSLNTNIHPRLWSANALSVYQWWMARSNAQVSFTFGTNNYQSLVNVTVRGATDPNTAVEVLLPGTNPVCTVQVWTNGNLASADNFRVNGQVIKLKVGNTVTNAVISYYPLGGIAAIFTQNFDGVTAPALPSGWTTTSSGVQTPWVTATGTNNSAPNSAFVGDPANVGLSELVSAVINIPGGASQLTFQNDYDLETGPGTDGFDGGVLEIKIGNGAFTDILAAGGTFVTGGYNSVIDTQWQNPLAGRAAWSGTSPGYITTTVNLPSAASGQAIQLKWRCGSDNSNGKTGWRIDSVKINNQACLCCNGTSNTPPVLNAQSDRTIAPLSTLTVTNTATDLDLPPQFLTYQLMSPPAGAAIDGNGVITWTPSNSQALTTNLIVTVVTDNGVPPMSATNAFTVTVSNTNTPPTITSQPVSATNNVGTMANFSVTASGSSLGFQWVKNGSIALVNGGTISGANTATLTIANVQMADAGTYSVMVSNSAGSVTSSAATLTVLNPYGTNLFTDDFTRSGNPGSLAPWVVDAGVWAVTNGMMNGGPSPTGQSYGYAYVTNAWTNYSVQARVRFSSINSYGGGLGARVNPVTGAHYAAWIFPENSNVGSSILRIIKFQEWIGYEYTNTTFQPMVQANLPGVGTNWHTLQLTVQGNQIGAYYDGVLVASVTDTESNPLMSGGISADMYTETSTYTLSYDDVTVTPMPTVLMAANDTYIMTQGGVLNVAAPGVMNNDTPGGSTNLTAARVSGPSKGTLTLNANGSFSYTPTNGFTGIDSFTYRLNDGVTNSGTATVAIDVAPSTNVFYDNFTRTGAGSAFAPWVVGIGEWNVTGGTLQGASTIANDYSDAYIPTDLTDFAIQARITLQSGGWAGGLSGRVDPWTGARYVANIYPEGSPLGPTPALRLIKFHSWNTWSSSFTPMALVNLPAVGTTPHTLRMTFQGNQIAVYFDGNQIVNMADNNADGLPPYTHGAFGAHMYMDSPHVATFDDLYVTSLVVNSSNTPPVLIAQSDRTVAALTTLTVTNAATDSDVPAQTLTYQLIAPPAGASISASGIITWTPTSGQAPSTNVIRTVVTDNGTPPMSATNAFNVVVTPGNSAPVLSPQPSVTIAELTTLTVTNAATDSNVPPQTLTYSLLSPPAGATISSSGVISWTPTEAQGPGTYTITTRVADNGTPPLSATNSFTVTVTEVNVAPVLPAQINRTIAELTALTVNNVATDADLPANALTYSLIAPPAGATISATGVITWTPSEAQGPGTNVITTVVTDNGTPAMIATNSFVVVVTEVNSAPVLPVQTNRTVLNQVTMTVTNTATDSDIPANNLTYALVNPPTGASIDTNGIITWTPTVDQTGSTNLLTTIVTDDGTPALSATNQFTVAVVGTNSAPVLSPQSNATIAELSALVVTNTATDSDVPAQTLTYSLVAPPAGATISSAGVISWTPTESQGPGAYTITTVVTDSGVPSMSATNSFTVNVTEVNSAPVLPAQINRTIAELTTLTVNNIATDSDIPANALTYSLVTPPAGASISSSGVITWTPTEAQGPSTNVITTVATDNGTPAMSATNSFVVVVTEVNSAPVLPVQTNRTVLNQVTMTVTNAASDSDIPANNLIYTLVNPPTGASIDTNGIITWTPSIGQTGTTNVITTIVTDDGTPALSATNQFTVAVVGTNSAPVLSTQPNVTIAELTALVVTNTATDSDVPAQTLSYSLVSPPAGATISSGGVISWAPTEAQGPGTYAITTIVTDSGVPSMSTTNSFTVNVTEVNVAPVLPSQINRTIAELATLRVTNTATDADLPANTLTYSLIGAPAGASISSSGVITWTPTEAQGPSTNVIMTVVTDNGVPQLSASNSFTVVVLETNLAPVLPVQTNRTIVNLATLVVTNTATDGDLPPQTLSYSLLAAPSGATIDTNGIITWTPTGAQTPSTNTITTVVTDNGTPPLSSTNSFVVTVVDTNLVVTLFSDDFTRTNGSLSPWISQSGTWRISGGVLTGTAKGQGYGFLYLPNSWTNYSVEAQVRFSATAYAGGLGAYVNTGNGSRYAAWIYPESSAGGSNLLRLLKFKSWKNYSYTNGGAVPMAQANLAGVGTNWHTLKIAVSGNQIAAYYDSNQVATVTDAEATPFSGGAVSIDLRTGSGSDTMTVDNLVVKSIPGGLAPLAVLGPDVPPAAPVIESVKLLEGSAVVSWTAVPGNTYRLQYTESLDDPNWQDATENIVALDATLVAVDAIGNAPQRFYRVVLVR